MFKDYVRALKEGTEHLNFGREIIAEWSAAAFPPAASSEPVSVLDLGCGRGDDLVNVRNALGTRATRLYGIEAWGPSREGARGRGIEAVDVNLENGVYPFPDASMDLIIANQIIEHTKEIFWIFSECGRLLKTGGLIIVGVPNLASLHNRILLLFGDQPSSIELLGPHVRGITVAGFRRFIEADGIFRIEQVRGSNFYPLPPALSRLLSAALPRLSVSLFFLIRKTPGAGRFDPLASRFYETNYLRPAK